MYVDWICKYEDTGKIPMPNNSYGNGAAMRVSPVAYVFDEIETVEKYARLQAEITHCNSEGIRGCLLYTSGRSIFAKDVFAKTRIAHSYGAISGWKKSAVLEYLLSGRQISPVFGTNGSEYQIPACVAVLSRDVTKTGRVWCKHCSLGCICLCTERTRRKKFFK